MNGDAVTDRRHLVPGRGRAARPAPSAGPPSASAPSSGCARAAHRRPGHRRRRAGQQPGQARRRGRAAAPAGAPRPARPAWSWSPSTPGPGMADLTVSSRDGHSTAGTLGIGLGAIARQAELVRRLLRGRAGAPCLAARSGRPSRRPRRPGPAALTRPMTGEDGQRRRLRRPDRRGPAPGAGLRRARARPARPPRPPTAAAGRLPRRTGRSAGRAWSSTCTGRWRTPAAPRSPSPSWTPATGRAALRRARQHRRRRSSTATERRGLVSLPGIAGHQRPRDPRVRLPVRPGRPAGHALRRGGRPLAARRLPGPAEPVPAGDRGDPAARRRRAPRRRLRPGRQGVRHDRRRPAPLLQMALRVEHDIFVVRQRGREVAAAVGLEHQDQVRIATALSEVGRDLLRPVGGADVAVRTSTRAPTAGSAPSAVDLAAGRPLPDGRYEPQSGAVARLVDTLAVVTGEGDTVVRMSRRVPASAPALTPERLAELRAELGRAAPGSAAGRAGRAEPAAARRAGRGRSPARRAGAAQRGAGGDQPGRDGALQPALRGAGGDQPRRGRALRRAGREVGAAARGQRGQEPVPGQRQPRAARPGHRDHRAGPAARRLRVRPAHRRAGPPGRADPLLGGGPARRWSTSCSTWPRRSPAGSSRTGPRSTCGRSSAAARHAAGAGHPARGRAGGRGAAGAGRRCVPTRCCSPRCCATCCTTG